MSFILLFLAVIIGIGLLSCFRGEKIFSILLTLYAFLVTYRFVTGRLSGDSTAVIIGLIAAVVVALLAQYAKKAAFFLLGFLIGIPAGDALLAKVPLQGAYVRPVVILGCGVVLGIVFARWNRTFIRIGTSYLGGDLIGTAGLFLIFNYGKLQSYVNADVPTELAGLSHAVFAEFAQQQALYILITAVIFTFIGTHYQKHHH